MSSQSQIASGPGLVVPNIASNTIPEQLWYDAYRHLQIEEPSLVDKYEKISRADAKSNAQDITSQEHLQSLIKAKLDRTKKTTDHKKKLENVQYITKIKWTISTGLQVNPHAALAWSIACTALEMLVNVSQEAIANRTGLKYVIERLAFTDEIAASRISAVQPVGLRKQIRVQIVNLYEKLLHYLLQSTVYFHQHWVKTLLKDSIKLFDWNDLLKKVKDAEDVVNRDDAIFKKELDSANLQHLSELRNIARDEKDHECLRQLRTTDPRDDKKRIENEKGGLLYDAYKWILENYDFNLWRLWQNNANLLWIRGDPGKGKTMLLCGIVDELSRGRKEAEIIAYFFCQATNLHINSAQSVIRGLLYMLADEDPTSCVLPALRAKFDKSGAALFKDQNTWVVVKDLLKKIVEELQDKKFYFVVDALDECIEGRNELLDLIKNSPKHVKWLVSSRNWPDIEEKIDSDSEGSNELSLELNRESVSRAVNNFIDIEVERLTKVKKLDNEKKDSLRRGLSNKAGDTFLWVALVCQHLLEKAKSYNILKLLDGFPTSLKDVYDRIAKQLKDEDEFDLLKQIIAVSAAALIPLTLKEVGNLLVEPIHDTEYLTDLVKQTGFLTSHSRTISFVHLSAKEYVMTSSIILPEGISAVHQQLYECSMVTFSRCLCRNPYNMPKVGCHINDKPQTEDDLLAPLTYMILHWDHHFLTSWNLMPAYETRMIIIETFRQFLRTKFLYWIEALLWLRSLHRGIDSMIKLKEVFEQSETLTTHDLEKNQVKLENHDAMRFIMSCVYVEQFPLQLYASALFFSPTSSLIRSFHKSEMPSWVISKLPMVHTWPVEAMTFPINVTGRAFGEIFLAVSPNGLKLAVVGDDEILVRNAINGATESKIKVQDVGQACFASDSTSLIVTDAFSGVMSLYDCLTGKELRWVSIDEIQPSMTDTGQRFKTKGKYRSNKLASSLQSTYLVHSVGQRLNCRDARWHLAWARSFSDEIVSISLSSDDSKLGVQTRGNGFEVYIHVCLLDSGASLWTKEATTHLGFTPMAFFPSGDKFLYINPSFSADVSAQLYPSIMRIVSAETGIEVLSSEIPGCDLDPMFLDRHIVCASQSGGIYLVDYLGQSLQYVKRPRLTVSLCSSPLWLFSRSWGDLSFCDRQELGSETSSDRRIKCRYSAVSKNGRNIAIATSDSKVRTWNEQFDCQVFKANSESGISGLAITDDGLLAASWNEGGALWDLNASPIVGMTFEAPTTLGVMDPEVALSPQGFYIRYSRNCSDLMIRKSEVWLTLSTGIDYIIELELSSDGLLCVLGDRPHQGERSSYRIEVWSINCEFDLLHSIDEVPSRSFKFSPRGELLAYSVMDKTFQEAQLKIEIKETQHWAVIDEVLTDIGSLSGHELLRLDSWINAPNDPRWIDPSYKGMQVDRYTFETGIWVVVEGECVLKLPDNNYTCESYEVTGARVINVLDDGRPFILEFDVEAAIKDQETVTQR